MSSLLRVVSVWGQIGSAKITNVLIYNNNNNNIIINLVKEHLSTSQSAFHAFGTILDFKAIVQKFSSGVDKKECSQLIYCCRYLFVQPPFGKIKFHSEQIYKLMANQRLR